MRTSITFFTFALVVVSGQIGNLPSAHAADKPSGPSRDEFKDIVIYNIFNPDRGPRPEPKQLPPVKLEPPPPKVERLTLTGVLKSDHGAYGFFDGTDRDFQRVAKPGDVIGKFKVVRIGIDSAELSEGTNNFSLKLGGELSRGGDGPWKAAEATTFVGTGAAPQATAGSASSSGSGDAADAERRKKLLELLKKKRESAK